MEKRTIVSASFESEIVEIKNEKHLKLTFQGIGIKSAQTSPDYCNQKRFEVYVPIWAVPYMMEPQRKTIAKWEESQLTLINDVKNAYNTKIEPSQK